MASKKELKQEIDQLQSEVIALKARIAILEARPIAPFTQPAPEPYKITKPFTPYRITWIGPYTSDKTAATNDYETRGCFGGTQQ